MLFNENERIYINSLELNAEVGLGRTPQNPISEIYGITRSFWNLDEETGDRLDVFGLNDLSPNIGPTAQPGIINNAVNLVRSSLQSVSITDAAQTDLNPGLSDLSISTWIFPVIMTGVANYYIIGKGCDANSSPEQTGYAIYLNGTGTSTASRISVLFGAPPATAIGGFVTFDAVISPSVWTHLVVTFDRAGVISLYVNGALITAVSAGSRTIDSLGDNSGQCDTIAPFVIGGNSSTAGLGIQTFDGRIDATGVFPVVLNQQQVSMLYNGGVGVQLNSALIGTWLQNDGSDPQVMMRLSNDGGKTWGLERWRGAGKTGEYNKRIVWYRLGQGRKRVFEISTTDNIPWRLLGASIDLRPSTLIKQAG